MKNVFIASFLIVFCFNSQLRAQEITAFPGFFGMQYYQDENRLTIPEVNELFKSDPEVNKLWRQAKTNESIAYGFLAAEVGAAIWMFTELDKDEDAVAPLVTVLGTAILGTVFISMSTKKKKDAILKYNSNLEKKVSLDLNINKYGLGLAVSF